DGPTMRCSAIKVSELFEVRGRAVAIGKTVVVCPILEVPVARACWTLDGLDQRVVVPDLPVSRRGIEEDRPMMPFTVDPLRQSIVLVIVADGPRDRHLEVDGLAACVALDL